MNYHNITDCDMLNGTGLRVVLWVSGCDKDCPKCHNPITHDPNGGIKFDYNALKEIMGKLDNDYIEGLTISGGDPLYPSNRDVILGLVKHIKEYFPDKNIWMYTGYLYEEVSDLEILDYVDILCDGPYIYYMDSPNKHWVGSSNQRVIDIKKSSIIGG